MQSFTYRPDIDGLRAFAVLPVIWFHSGLPGLPGGFTGVDTFFVISGFLISSIIYREIRDGSFSFKTFYEGRFRRIAPALVAVLGVTFLVGSVLLLPFELEKLAQSTLAATLAVPNIFFWREAGYFALGTQSTPLLHTWSLGVEEQFYLFFPPALIVLARLRLLRPGLIVATIASFALCVAGTAVAPSLSFFMLPMRAWEMLLGCLFGVGVVALPLSPALRSATSLLGLAFMFAATILITEDDAFPGAIAAAPALGAVLLIASGPGAIANRILAFAPFVGVGKISYSLYLWHWPVMVFMRHYLAAERLSTSQAVLAIALSFALAAATYVFIEQPARRPDKSTRSIGRLTFAGSAAVSACSIAAIVMSGWPSRLPPAVIAANSPRYDVGTLVRPCENAPVGSLATDCSIGQRRPTALLWGDSHSAAVADGVAAGLGRTTMVSSMNNCLPAQGWVSPKLKGRDVAACQQRNAALLALVLADPEVQTVVLSAYWSSHARSSELGIWPHVEELVRELRKGGKKVVILGGIPEPGYDVPWASAIRERFGRQQQAWDCPVAIVPIDDVIVADLSADFCRNPRPLALFSDSNHPTLMANREVIGPALAAILRGSPQKSGVNLAEAP